MKASKIGRLTCSSVIHSVKICMIISGFRPHSIQVGYMGAWLKAVLLLCVTYETVANFSLVLTHGISLAPLTCFISACFRPGQNSSVERYFKDGYHSTDYLLVLPSIRSLFYSPLSSRAPSSLGYPVSPSRKLDRISREFSSPLCTSCNYLNHWLRAIVLLVFFFFFFFSTELSSTLHILP